MKQYTTPEQTAKLIELGFEKPKTPISYSYPDPSEKQKEYEASLGLGPYLATVDQIEFESAYSIGELIEILPEYSNIYDLQNLATMEICWYVGHISTLNVSAPELIDALYDMIVKLKEEGVI